LPGEDDRCEERLVVIVVLKDASAGVGLAASSRPCAGCGGRLRPWGFARVRTIRCRGGRPSVLRPRRVRCGGCRITHVVLPAACVPRRADDIQVIGAALLASVQGRGHRLIAAGLGVPEATVRGWIRRATAQAEWLRCEATRLVPTVDPMLGPLLPAGSALADALYALGAVAAAVICRLGPIASPWHLIAVIARGRLLAPLRS